jgi:hypothetical protein
MRQPSRPPHRFGFLALFVFSPIGFFRSSMEQVQMGISAMGKIHYRSFPVRRWACLHLPASGPEHLHAICWLPAVRLPTCADCVQRL